jgi:hypothetical protein
MSFGCEFYSVIGGGLMDIAVLVALGLGMPDQNYHLQPSIDQYIGPHALKQHDLPVVFPWLSRYAEQHYRCGGGVKMK